MTCIIGIVGDDKHVYLMGDRASVASTWDTHVMAGPKVFRRGHFVIGYTTSFRMGQLLQYGFSLPEPPNDQDALFGWMVTVFVEDLREAMKRGGFAKTVNGEETAGHFLVGVHSRLFQVHEDFHVGEYGFGFDAIGCGHAYARGALYANHTLAIGPVEKLSRAMKAAAAFSAGVRSPFDMVSTNGSAAVGRFS